MKGRGNFIFIDDVLLIPANGAFAMKKKFILIITSISIIVACSKSNDSTGDPGDTPLDCSAVTAKSYAADVSFIIQTKCATDAACHGSGSTNGPGPLLNYTAVFNARTAIRAAVASGEMPKTGSITTAQKNSILCWIDAGASNN